MLRRFYRNVSQISVFNGWILSDRTLRRFTRNNSRISIFNGWMLSDRTLQRFYDAGMPTETPTFNKTLCEESEGLADKWASAAEKGEEKLADAESAKFEAWTSPQKVCVCVFVRVYERERVGLNFYVVGW